MDGFTVNVSSDRDTYSDGEDVIFTVEVCNQGPATTTEGGGGSDIPFSFVILDEQGDRIADDTHAIRTMELRTVRWATGQCRQGQFAWDQHYWNRPEDAPSEPPEVHGLPVRGELVPPGNYEVQIAANQGTATTSFELHRPGA